MPVNPEHLTLRQKRLTAESTVALPPRVFGPYVQHLKRLLDSNGAQNADARTIELAAALDGQPGKELRKLYTLDRLRSSGTYFTGSKLAGRLVNSSKALLFDARQVIDPACGAGDLLVASARHLPIQADVSNTLREWGKRLVGIDINPAFVEAARYRLALLAIERIGAAKATIPRGADLGKLLPRLRVGSGMDEWGVRAGRSVVVVNPPFVYGEASAECPWAVGRVSQAALFVDQCLKSVEPGTKVLAILPDVLRTGTRYERWRKMITENAKIRSVKIAGRFDDLTEVSVFLLNLEVGNPTPTKSFAWARPSMSTRHTVKNSFEIRVGPVVPFRLTGAGAWCPYAHSEVLPAWKNVKKLKTNIRFEGTTYDAPFVAIRRTSKAGYPIRCIGTIVSAKKSVAVENHLLLAIPRDRKIGSCRKLLRLLKRVSTSTWMNERIRCRHLTVSSIGDLPWAER